MNSLKEKYEKEQNKWKNKNTKSIVTITEENIAEVIKFLVVIDTVNVHLFTFYPKVI